MGISDPTHVALQYARAFPDHVDRLILDSIVGPDGPDPFLLDTYRNNAACARGAVRSTARAATRRRTRWPTWACSCGGSTPEARCAARYYDTSGRKRAHAYSTPDELPLLLIAGDLNPFLEAALPARHQRRAAGRTRPRSCACARIGQGGPTRRAGLSRSPSTRPRAALDVTLPFDRAAGVPPPTARPQAPAGARGDPAGLHHYYSPGSPRPCCARATATIAWRGRTDDVIRAPVHRAPARRPGAAARRPPGHRARPSRTHARTAQELPHATIVALKGLRP